MIGNGFVEVNEKEIDSLGFSLIPPVDHYMSAGN
jgi:hypothetical protein